MTTTKETFIRAVQLKRPHGSTTEARFVAWLANRLPVTMIDGAGNVHVDLRRLPSDRTLFTAHTDTVHWDGGVNSFDEQGGVIRAKGDVLGADDAAGIALLHHMIVSRVPGYYILFRGEECGGIGSKWLASNMPELLCEFDHAVAFDRAGYHDVITHQGGERCCSDAFAQALAEQLSTEDFALAFAPCDAGVYTDTKEFVHLIPECTNVSVGYFKQHTTGEYQDMAFLEALAQQLVQVNWSVLPVARTLKTSVQPKLAAHSEKTYVLGLLQDLKENPRDSGTWWELTELALGEEYDLSLTNSIVTSLNFNRVTPRLIRTAIELVEQDWDPIQVVEMMLDEVT